MDKASLRLEIRKQKRAMTRQQIEGKSHLLGALFLSSPQYRDAGTIYGYLPYNQEVRTAPILERALLDCKRVALPKVYGQELRFIYVDDLSAVRPGYAGIPEPVADGPVAEDAAALVLMPGLAFDMQGHRLGYGGGFYDRFLAREPGHPTVALCYDFQVLPELPVQAFDVSVDCVLWA